jgi:hypothetical protein
MNLTHCYDWKYDVFTKTTAAKIFAMHAADRKSKGKSRIGVSWQFQHSVDFYIVKRKIKKFRRTNRKGPDGVFDYYYVLDSDKHVIVK